MHTRPHRDMWTTKCKPSALVSTPAQVDYGGEDSFFVSDVGGGAFGIADGVGGWQESGVNPAGASM